MESKMQNAAETHNLTSNRWTYHGYACKEWLHEQKVDQHERPARAFQTWNTFHSRGVHGPIDHAPRYHTHGNTNNIHWVATLISYDCHCRGCLHHCQRLSLSPSSCRGRPGCSRWPIAHSSWQYRSGCSPWHEDEYDGGNGGDYDYDNGHHWLPLVLFRNRHHTRNIGCPW